MKGLTTGRNVHYVLWLDGEGGGSHITAFIIDILDKERGFVQLYVVPSGEIDNFKVNAEYSEFGLLGTWHWIEPA